MFTACVNPFFMQCTPTPPLLPLPLPSYPYFSPPTPTPPLLPLLLPSYPYSSPPIPILPSSPYSSPPTPTPLLPVLLPFPVAMRHCHTYHYPAPLSLPLPLPNITSILPIVSSQHSFTHFNFIEHVLSCLYALTLHITIHYFIAHGAR